MRHATRFVPGDSVTALLLIGICGACAFAAGRHATPAKASSAGDGRLAKSYGQLPLSFEANRGQAGANVQFLSRGGGYSLSLTEDGAVLSLSEGKSGRSDAIRMELTGTGARATGRVLGEEPLPGVSNYFLGKDPARWRTNVPNYARVRYSGVYPGIDLVYYGNRGELEYDFAVAAEADPSAIRLRFDGAEAIALAPSGDLTIRAKSGEIAFRKPEIYQEIEGKRVHVAGCFRLAGSNTVAFTLGGYDRSRALVIDPVLAYSTYLGGSTSDAAYGIAVDAQGSAYVVGTTFSSDFPTTSGAHVPKDKSFPAIFITKFNPAGSALVYSTYLSGDGSAGGGDYGAAIAVDSGGNAYVTGTVFTPDFPVTEKAFQPIPPMQGDLQRSSAFVAKLNPTGSTLMYSTYLGGSAGGTGAGSGDAATSIAVDSAGNAYVAGFTSSTNFPVTAGAFQTTQRSAPFCSNAFVSKLNPTGTSLVYSTYLGGETEICEQVYRDGVYVQLGDSASGIAVDADGDAYVTGNTLSVDYPRTANAFQLVNNAPGYGLGNAFLTKVNPAGSDLVYSTFLGGPNPDEYLGCVGNAPGGIAVDPAGNAYVTGATASYHFPTTAKSLQPAPSAPPHGDCPGYGYVSKLDPTGSALVFSTYLGGDLIAPSGIAVDASGNSYIAGSVFNLQSGYEFGYFNATPGAISASGDIFVAKLNAAGSALEYGTSLGSANSYLGTPDTVHAFALDAGGNAYLAGQANSSAYPTTSGAFQPVNQSPNNFGDQRNVSGNAFVSKLALAGETGSYVSSYISLTSAPVQAQAGQSATLTAVVSGPPSAAVPTGKVSFFGWYCTNNANASSCEDTTPVEGALDAKGFATGMVPNLKPGYYTFYASYLGDAKHLTSSSIAYGAPLQTTVLGPPATVSLIPGGNTYGQAAFLEARVLDSVGYPVAGVPVNFSAPLGFHLLATSAVTNSDGVASVGAVATAVGTFSTTASVSGTSLTSTSVSQNLPAPLTVSIHNALRTYGSPNPAFTASFRGLVGSDSVTITYQTAATAASPVGSYPIAGTLGGANASNYVATFVPGAVQVHPAPLTVAANNATSIYGQTPGAPTAYRLTGFVNGDSSDVVTGAPVMFTSVTAASPVGFYPTSVQIGTLQATNYTFLAGGNGVGGIQVLKAPLRLLPASFTIHAGDPLPAFPYSITGFVNGDTQATATTGAPSLTTVAPNTNTPGRYYIVANVGTLAARNYSFNQPSVGTDGILTILPK